MASHTATRKGLKIESIANDSIFCSILLEIAKDFGRASLDIRAGKLWASFLDCLLFRSKFRKSSGCGTLPRSRYKRRPQTCELKPTLRKALITSLQPQKGPLETTLGHPYDSGEDKARLEL